MYSSANFLQVRMEDQVTFSSEKTEGQYIHTSGRVFHQVGIFLHENWLDHQEKI